MKRPFFLIFFLLLSGLTGCGLRDVDNSEQRTATPQAFSTATPGGWVSVWMLSPTGQLAGTQSAAENPIPDGTLEIVAPAASATAAVKTIIAATQTATVTPPTPDFAMGECPQPGALTPPELPASFSNFPAVIGVYLSNGGPPAVLETALRGWGSMTDEGGFVQADTDLTGDNITEVVVNMFNPYVYNPRAVMNAGQLLVFGCDNGGYRLLYSTPANPGLALPVVHRVGDMNADIKAELVFDVQSCTTSYCTREGYILSWNQAVGAFEAINTGQILAINGRIDILDVDSDGILELTALSSPPSNRSSGPTRSVQDVWDWTGLNYVLAVRVDEDARYRIHQLHDADEDLLSGNYRSALRGYINVRDDGDLLAWNLPNEGEMLRAFASYRMLITYLRTEDNRSIEAFTTLVTENPSGSPAEGIAQMGQAVMSTIRASNSLSEACRAALGIAATRPEILTFLNSYGYSNRTYTLEELCPF